MDPMQMTLIVGALAVIGVGGVLFALFGASFEADAKRAKRIAAYAPAAKNKPAKAAATDRLRQSAQANVAAKIKELSDQEKERTSFSMKQKLIQAGLENSSPAKFMLNFYIAAVIAAGGVIVGLQQPPLVGALVGAVVAFGLPRLWLGKMISRRQRKFLEQFPNAIDIMVRGVRSGLPVNEGLKVIGNEIPDPVKTEFQRVVDATSVGVPFEDSLTKMHERMNLPEVNFFRTVLVIQKQTGGNLAEALGNLSGILRERKKLKGKIKALSSEAKMSAMIIGSLPFVVGFLVYLVTPDYIMSLFNDPRGHFMIGGGLFWMSCGIMMMRSMINFEA